MTSVKIVVPSHLRADRVKIFERGLPRDAATLVVAEGQADLYAAFNPDVEIDTHPDDLIGLPAKRNWMYARYGSIFMVDDDTHNFVHLEHVSGDPTCVVEPDEAVDLIQRAADAAADLGVYLFGFAATPDRRGYMDQLPFLLSGRVVGQSMGLLAGSGLTWNTAITAKTDYWITLLNAHHHRIALIDRRYATVVDPVFATSGGTAAHRTPDTERRDTEILREYFGTAIREKKRTPFAEKGDKGHGEQITLKIPW